MGLCLFMNALYLIDNFKRTVGDDESLLSSVPQFLKKGPQLRVSGQKRFRIDTCRFVENGMRKFDTSLKFKKYFCATDG